MNETNEPEYTEIDARKLIESFLYDGNGEVNLFDLMFGMDVSMSKFMSKGKNSRRIIESGVVDSLNRDVKILNEKIDENASEMLAFMKCATKASKMKEIADELREMVVRKMCSGKSIMEVMSDAADVAFKNNDEIIMRNIHFFVEGYGGSNIYHVVSQLCSSFADKYCTVENGIKNQRMLRDYGMSLCSVFRNFVIMEIRNHVLVECDEKFRMKMFRELSKSAKNLLVEIQKVKTVDSHVKNSCHEFNDRFGSLHEWIEMMSLVCGETVAYCDELRKCVKKVGATALSDEFLNAASLRKAS